MHTKPTLQFLSSNAYFNR